MYGTSGRSTATTLGGAVLNSCNAIEADADDVSLTINVTVFNSSYKYYIYINNGSETYLSFPAQTWGVGTSSFDIKLDSQQRQTLLNKMSSVKSFTATVKLISKSGDSQIGNASTRSVNVFTTPEKSSPVLPGFVFMDTDETTTSITGDASTIIQGYSFLSVTPDAAESKNGASIVSYTASCGDASSSVTTNSRIGLGAIMSSGERDIVVTVADSRGYTASITKKVQVVPYQNPVFSSCLVRRTNDIEDEIQLSFSGFISVLSVNGEQKNSVTSSKYRYKSTGDTEWGEYSQIDVIKSGSSFSFNDLEFTYLDADSSFDFQVVIEDSLSSMSVDFVIPQGTPLLALRKKRVGINTPNPNCALDVVGDASISGALLVNGVPIVDIIYPVGSIYLSTSNTDPGFIFGGKWSQIRDRFLYCTGSDTLKTGGSNSINLSHRHTTSGHALTLSEIPSHRHSEDTSAIRWASPNGNCELVYSGNDVGSGNYGGGTKYTGYAGSGASHSHGNTGSSLSSSVNIMPSYITVHCWYRIS